jgi:predicted glycoside hydrolase/deacetylase ChbG (UPF0249 family)
MSDERAICFCIDDFGLHAHVNDAALSLLSDGRVQAVGCMVGAPAWAEGAERLRRETAPPFDVGLHLDLTAFPLTVAPRAWPSLWRQGVLDRLDIANLRVEIAAQLDAFERQMGRTPDFIDGHQHIHQFPRIRQALIDTVLRRFPHGKPWLRSTRASGWGLKARVIHLLGSQSLIQEADRIGLRHNRTLLGVYDFNGGPKRYERLLQGWLRSARHGDLLMCHPGLGYVPGDEIAQARVNEFEVLSGKLFDWLVRSSHVRLRAMSLIVGDRRWPRNPGEGLQNPVLGPGEEEI